MNNIPCEIIQDLLPLYCDGVCSEESKKMILAHIQNCDKCREELRVMGLPVSISEQKEEIEAAVAASRIWKKNKRKAFGTGIILTVLAWAIVVIVYLCQHYMQTVAIDDVAGLEYSMEAYSDVDNIDIQNVAQKGEYLAISGCDEKGLWHIGIYVRDKVFGDRWKELGSMNKVKPGKLAGWNYKTPDGDTIFVCFGEGLSDEISGYKFVNDGITYSCPVEENSVLDFFFISDTVDSRIRLEPVYEQ